jgi:hypothetical protein
LIDLAKKRGVELAFNWETVIKPEYRREFFQMYRETYNFLKHGDNDESDLPVHNIAEGNAVALTMAIENYMTMFGMITEHMKTFRFFALLWKPKWFSREIENIISKERMEYFTSAMGTLRTATPVQFFEALQESRANYNNLERERTLDVSDGHEFYTTPFEDHKF